jgi:hypothetical protein
MKRLLAAFTSLSAIVMAARATIITDALWGSGDTYQGRDCVDGVATDGNGFCSIQDGPFVLGVTFEVSSPTLITGVRIYRVDTGVAKGTLWKDGIVLASGQFAGSGTHEWSDLVFNWPVPVNVHGVLLCE